MEHSSSTDDKERKRNESARGQDDVAVQYLQRLRARALTHHAEPSYCYKMKYKSNCSQVRYMCVVIGVEAILREDLATVDKSSCKRGNQISFLT